MEILKFENSSRPVRKKSSSSKVVLGLAGIAAVALLGSTLAANISLNGGTGVEFGQGVALTTACDDSITSTPAATFVNASNGGAFNFSTVAFSNISAACLGKTFTLKAFGDTSATPLVLATSGATTYSLATFNFTTFSTTSPGITTSSYTGSGTNGQLSLGFSGTQATSGAVYKLTLESQ
ncbi:hypothetical protein [Haliscomenobacter sp.]|uniref:hypothetical protein n=1 Tax=Haliscomenobacter sp. TaxID=2717303 RepID=UPI00336509A2